MKVLCSLLCCLLGVFSLAACTIPVEVEQEQNEVGGASPEEVVDSFFHDLNQALVDPELPQRDVRRAWAERLASYFAPSERVDQRSTLNWMLANFAAELEQLDPNQHLTLEIDYLGVQTIEQENMVVGVRLLNGTLRYRRVQILDNGYRNVLRDQQRPLHEVLGEQGELLPVLEVNGRWFLTER